MDRRPEEADAERVPLLRPELEWAERAAGVPELREKYPLREAELRPVAGRLREPRAVKARVPELRPV
jgi:hypothetical protein